MLAASAGAAALAAGPPRAAASLTFCCGNIEKLSLEFELYFKMKAIVKTSLNEEIDKLNPTKSFL